MYAVVKTGGKQYRVSNDDLMYVEKLDVEEGKTVEFTEVLLVNDGNGVKVGSPIVKDATVTATVVSQKRNDKVIVFKRKRRQGYRRTHGHRQYVTVLKVNKIEVGKASSAK